MGEKRLVWIGIVLVIGLVAIALTVLFRPANVVDSFRKNPIISEPDLVTIRRLYFQPHFRREMKYFGMTPSEIVSQLPNSKAQELLDLLSTATNITSQEPMKCSFVPGFVLEFNKNGKTGRVLVCLHCDEYVLLLDDNPKGVRSGWFKRGRPEIVRWAKQEFPNDDEIQKLSPIPSR